MWINEKPTETGYYWFYGDPFWDQLPHNEEKNINPFEPKLELILVRFVREGSVMYVCKGALCYKMKGVWWDEKIKEPELPK